MKIQRCFWGALNTSLFSHNHSKFSTWQESNTTSDITTLFWPGQDGHQFWAQPANLEQLKSSFPLPYTKKRVGNVSKRGSNFIISEQKSHKQKFHFSIALQIGIIVAAVGSVFPVRSIDRVLKGAVSRGFCCFRSITLNLEPLRLES